MPRAPSNEIPYNVPWGKKRGAQPINERAGRITATQQGRSQDGLLQRTPEIFEPPTRHPLEREPQRGELPTTGSIAIALILLGILLAIYQCDVRLSSSRSELAYSRIHTASSPPRVEIRWGYDSAKPIPFGLPGKMTRVNP